MLYSFFQSKDQAKNNAKRYVSPTYSASSKRVTQTVQWYWGMYENVFFFFGGREGMKCAESMKTCLCEARHVLCPSPQYGKHFV